jgi:hypothetical protein
MEKITLKLEGHHFKRQYLLYIVEISHENDKHYYVGQTGDHNYTTARPAFRRLAGHLEDLGGSTQNQIYRYIAEIVLGFSEAGQKNSKFDEKIKLAVEEYLVDSTITMHVYPLQPFSPGIEKDQHLEIVRKVSLFEKMVINLFNINNKRIANKKLTLPEKGAECPYPRILDEIIKDFNLNN